MQHLPMEIGFLGFRFQLFGLYFVEGNDGEVSCSKACVQESSTGRKDHSAGPWHKTGAVGEGGLHIQMTPSKERFNRDGGLEVPGCWIAVMMRQGGRSNPH